MVEWVAEHGLALGIDEHRLLNALLDSVKQHRVAYPPPHVHRDVVQDPRKRVLRVVLAHLQGHHLPILLLDTNFNKFNNLMHNSNFCANLRSFMVDAKCSNYRTKRRSKSSIGLNYLKLHICGMSTSLPNHQIQNSHDLASLNHCRQSLPNQNRDSCSRTCPPLLPIYNKWAKPSDQSHKAIS